MDIILHKANNIKVIKEANKIKGLTMIEIDLVMNSKKELVLGHNPYKADEEKLSLKDALKIINQKNVMLDLKIIHNNKQFIKVLVESLKNQKFTFYISSFNHYAIIDLIKRKNKNKLHFKAKYGLIIHSAFVNFERYIYRKIDYISVNNMNYFRKLSLPKRLKIYGYTINDMNESTKQKMHGIITDFPKLILKQLKN